MSRTKDLTARSRREITLSQRTLDETDLLLAFQAGGQPKHGAFSKLVERLLRVWLDEQAHSFPTTTPIEAQNGTV